MNKNIFLVTGSAGFIGYHLSIFLLKKNFYVLGVDNINNYYSVDIKKARVNNLKKFNKFSFIKLDLSNKKKLFSSLDKFKNSIKCVFHLAAQAGVRYSIERPDKYITSNLNAFFNIIDFTKSNKIPYFFYASSSSVYGDNTGKLSLSKKTSKPLSLYAATKKANEVIAHSYSEMFGLKTIGLRFFTVYGPFGRPDMSIFKFTQSLILNKPIELYNNGNHSRDFTYVEDAVSLIYAIYINRKKIKNSNIFNISNGNKIKITYMLDLLKKYLKIDKIIISKLPLQPGDINTTLSDTSYTNKFTKKYRRTPIEIGLKKFIKWYREYYSI